MGTRRSWTRGALPRGCWRCGGARLAAVSRGNAGGVGHRRLRVPGRAERRAARVAWLEPSRVRVVGAPGGLSGGGSDAVGGGRGGVGGREGLDNLMADLLGVVRPGFEHQVDGALAFLGRDLEADEVRFRQGVVKQEVGDRAEWIHLLVPLKEDGGVAVIQDVNLYPVRALIVLHKGLDKQVLPSIHSSQGDLVQD